MCSVGKTLIVLLTLTSVLSVVQAQSNHLKNNNINLSNLVKNLLINMERSNVWDENLHFALIFSEFIIKQKVRFFEPTRYENQLYAQILKKIATFRNKIISKKGIGRLANILQKNAVAFKPSIVKNQLNTELEYQSLGRNYEILQNFGFPNSTFSDYCLFHISSLDACNRIDQQCLQVVSSNASTYGYHRMHQILLLYILMHHSCAEQIGSPLLFEILSTQHCSEVYREHRILEFSHSQARRDLYVEQSALCGLFGFEEFLNLAEIRKIVSWDTFGVCRCTGKMMVYQTSNERDMCKCSDHSHSVSLLLYVNAMLLLS